MLPDAVIRVVWTDARPSGGPVLSEMRRSLPSPLKQVTWLLPMLVLLVAPVGAALQASRASGDALPEVQGLTGEADFRAVTLRWVYPQPPSPLRPPLFALRYCELQAWGPQRCRTKVVTWGAGRDAQAAPPEEAVRVFKVAVNQLRMATNYSFEVQAQGEWPEGDEWAVAATARRARKPRTIIVPTKGFSARATRCLPHASEVEVQTGPHFAGRIAVEGGEAEGEVEGAGCAVAGDPLSARAAYVLRIDHAACGHVHLNATHVAAHVLVQEALPILTHSTRRFLVLCSYQPPTLTVRAGIHLPTRGAAPGDEGEAEAANAVEERSEAPQHLQRHLHLVDLPLEEAAVQDQTATQLVLMVIVVAATVVGATLFARWISAKSKRKSADLSSISPGEACASLCENYENSLREVYTADERTNPSDTEDTFGDAVSDAESCSNVFTIYTPPRSENVHEAQSCIIIEHSSQSEA